LFVTVTNELLLHEPLITVHTNLLAPDDNPVTEVLADDGLLITDEPVPDHNPLPMDGTIAFNDAVFVHTLKSFPACDIDGVLFVTFT
jgi:hypothetical protein